MLAIAALSARVLAETAAREGLRSIAFDVFGDADTRCHAEAWHAIGVGHALRIDGERLLAALDRLACHGDVHGWIAGAGFEGRPDLLAQGAARLPLIGTAAADVRRVRDAREFFQMLDGLGIGFPPVAFERPRDTAGWLFKDAGGCGGWQVRHATPADVPTQGRYWQREHRGEAMSATFIGNGRDAVLLGLNRQGSCAIGARPFVFTRVVGPVPASEALQRQLNRHVRRLAEAFRVRGLASLDFLCEGDTVEVLELNPRPAASLALYPRVGRVGVLHAHLRACECGELPAAVEPDGRVRGSEIVFAPRLIEFDAARAAALAACAGTCDLPHAPVHVGKGDPLCSVFAEGAGEAEVNERLATRREAVLATLETTT